MTNATVIAALQQHGAERLLVLQTIYQTEYLRKTIVKHVLANGGCQQDADDVFQETFIAFERSVRLGNFRGACDWKSFYICIGIRMWTQPNTKQTLPEAMDDIVDPELVVISSEKRKIINKILVEIGDRCKETLTLYGLSYSMEEIAAIMQFSSAEMAKKAAYQCRKKFRAFVETYPYYKKLLNIIDK
jgi:RNA polymerase sigma factor (sigma-70 family)